MLDTATDIMFLAVLIVCAPERAHFKPEYRPEASFPSLVALPSAARKVPSEFKTAMPGPIKFAFAVPPNPLNAPATTMSSFGNTTID